MPSIMDIGPLSDTVSLRGTKFDVRGVGADTLILLLKMFPDLHRAIGQREEMTVEDFYKFGPDVVAAIIAVGCGMPATNDSIDSVKSLGLTVGEQMIALKSILSMTFPQGFGPFVNALTEVVDGGRGAQPTEAPVTN